MGQSLSLSTTGHWWYYKVVNKWIWTFILLLGVASVLFWSWNEIPLWASFSALAVLTTAGYLGVLGE